jgi:hypothetical protein
MTDISIYGSLSPVHYNKLNIIINSTYLINFYTEKQKYIYFYYKYKNTEIIFMNGYLLEGYFVLTYSDPNYIKTEMTKINNNNYTIYCSESYINIAFDYFVNNDTINVYLKFIFKNE